MRQITVILVTAALTAMATVFSMIATSSNPVRTVRTSAEVRAPDPIDVMKMMTDAKDLPDQSYPAH